MKTKIMDDEEKSIGSWIFIWVVSLSLALLTLTTMLPSRWTDSSRDVGNHRFHATLSRSIFKWQSSPLLCRKRRLCVHRAARRQQPDWNASSLCDKLICMCGRDPRFLKSGQSSGSIGTSFCRVRQLIFTGQNWNPVEGNLRRLHQRQNLDLDTSIWRDDDVRSELPAWIDGPKLVATCSCCQSVTDEARLWPLIKTSTAYETGPKFTLPFSKWPSWREVPIRFSACRAGSAEPNSYRHHLGSFHCVAI